MTVEREAGLPKPLLMGIVNVTPDSFSDGGQLETVEDAVAHAMTLAEEGADILDLGGESTRPGAAPVNTQEEMDRVLPVLERLRGETDALLSVDTRKPEVAKAAAAIGVDIWNDVSALRYSEDSLQTAALLGMTVVLMHAQGDPQTMQDAPFYDDVVADVVGFLRHRRNTAISAGVRADHIVLDPGIGFGKTLEHNLALLRNLGAVVDIGAPVLLGASRKRFIAALDRQGDPAERIGGSVAVALAGVAQGVHWLRVHDVAETRQALAVAAALEHD